MFFLEWTCATIEAKCQCYFNSEGGKINGNRKNDSKDSLFVLLQKIKVFSFHAV